MRQLLGLGVIAIGGIAVYAAVTGNYKAVVALLNQGRVGVGGAAKVWPFGSTTTTAPAIPVRTNGTATPTAPAPGPQPL